MSLDVSLGVIGNQIWNWDSLGHSLRVHQAMYFGRQEKCRIRPMAYTDLINNAFEEISQRGKIHFALFTVFKKLLKTINIME